MTPASAPISTTRGDGDVESLGEDDGRSIGASVVPGSVSVWQIDTDLVYVLGSKKVMLTIQMLLIHMVVQDAFETLRASLLFENTFLDPNLTVLYVRKNLIGAARGNLPRAVDIFKRLLVDDVYLNKLSCLVSGLPLIII